MVLSCALRVVTFLLCVFYYNFGLFVWSGTHDVAQDDLKLVVIILPQLP